MTNQAELINNEMEPLHKNLHLLPRLYCLGPLLLCFEEEALFCSTLCFNKFEFFYFLVFVNYLLLLSIMNMFD